MAIKSGYTQEDLARLGPDALTRKRMLAEALLADATKQREIKHPLQGLAQMAEAFVSGRRVRKLEEAEATGRASGESAWGKYSASNLFGSPFSTPGATGGSMPSVSPSGDTPANPTVSSDYLPSSFVAAVDRTEGAGGYDTLFGHAQKNGPFAGTTVSGMPIKDVLAFQSPSGPYAQSVKNQIGRVATPVGRYQVVGTTLGNAVNELGLDPNAPFDQNAQDQVAAHLARKRIASADTIPGKITALRNEWAGFKNVPDAEMVKIVQDLESGPVASARPQAPPNQVASLDPSIGMPGAAGESQGTSPQPYRDPMVTTAYANPAPTQAAPSLPPPINVASAPTPPNAGVPSPNAQMAPQIPEEFQGSAQLMNADPNRGIVQALLGGQPATEQQVADARMRGNQQQQRIAQALMAPNGGSSMQAYADLMSNPWVSDDKKRLAQTLMGQQFERQNAIEDEQRKRLDPAYQADLEYKRAQTDALRNPKGEVKIMGNRAVRVMPDGTIEDVTPQTAGAKPGQFRFEGTSVEAQALNGLINSGALTVDQAQQLAAGKQVTGPNGEILFLTPQGIFSQTSQQPAEPQQQEIDIFGGRAPSAGPGTSPAAPVAQPAAPAAGPAMRPAPQSSAIQLTGPKEPTLDEKNAMTFSDRMAASGATIDDVGNKSGTDWGQRLISGIPFGIGNNFVNEDFQKFDQARRDFINAQLRRESGAVISDEEFDNANKQYFPQPGDTPAVLKQKAENRRIAIEGMKRSAGPSYRSPAAAPKAPAKIDGYTIEEEGQ